MKIRKREKIDSIYLCPEDTIRLSHRQEIELPNGTIEVTEKEVLRSQIGREMTLNEAVIFDVEPGDFKNATDGIGGAFLSCPKSTLTVGGVVVKIPHPKHRG